jgi:hypothetical protein
MKKYFFCLKNMDIFDKIRLSSIEYKKMRLISYD